MFTSLRPVSLFALLLGAWVSAACSRDAMPTLEEGLLGRWEWQQTATANQLALTPANTGHRMAVHFDQRGRARFYQDDKLVSAAAFTVRRDGMGFQEPVRHIIAYRGYQVTQYYSVVGNRLQLQDTDGRVATHSYIRIVSGPKNTLGSADLSLHLPRTSNP